MEHEDESPLSLSLQEQLGSILVACTTAATVTLQWARAQTLKAIANIATRDDDTVANIARLIAIQNAAVQLISGAAAAYKSLPVLIEDETDYFADWTEAQLAKLDALADEIKKAREPKETDK